MCAICLNGCSCLYLLWYWWSWCLYVGVYIIGSSSRLATLFLQPMLPYFYLSLDRRCASIEKSNLNVQRMQVEPISLESSLPRFFFVLVPALWAVLLFSMNRCHFVYSLPPVLISSSSSVDAESFFTPRSITAQIVQQSSFALEAPGGRSSFQSSLT